MSIPLRYLAMQFSLKTELDNLSLHFVKKHTHNLQQHNFSFVLFLSHSNKDNNQHCHQLPH